MIVKKTSVFPAGREQVCQKLKELKTLQYIAAPYATFEPVEDTAGIWEAGAVSAYRLKLFGLIPFGTHTIQILRFDLDGISSREGNEHVPVWNHDITLRSPDNNHTEYTDLVELSAGWKTVFIWLWAKAFYAHRQRRWIKLLEKEE